MRPVRSEWLGVLALSLGSLCAAQPVSLTTKPVATGLTRPVFVTYAPGDPDRLFIVQQFAGTSGSIKILDLKSGQVLPTPFLEVPNLITGGEQGLLGLAFHPQYQSNGYFYVNYTAPGGGASGHTVVERYKVSSNPDVADPSSASTVITIDQPYDNHNGGWLAFGPDGYLYIAMGDGGAGGDPQNHAQTLVNDLLGKMLRLDVDSDAFPAEPSKNYGIPPTNPFVGSAADDEIWAYGLRNPWRNSFDRLTGDLFIGDVGEGDWEELDFQAAGVGGANYGWHCMEGPRCTSLSACNCPQPLGVAPIHTYSHGDGCSIIGGYVYRGCALEGFRGTYFFADLCLKIWSLRYEGGVVTALTSRTEELRPNNGPLIGPISSLGEDFAGELYVVDYSHGKIFKIVARATPLPDCNSNGIADSCDIESGTSKDKGADGIPDECQCTADFNRDGFIDGVDSDLFMLAFESAAGADFNGDGFVDGIDADQFNLRFEAGDAEADINRDGFVDGIDADVFNRLFEGGILSPDVTQDGFVDGIDYDTFVNDFESGCR